VGHDVLRDRRTLSEVGLVTVVLAVARESLKLVTGPELRSLGVTFHEVEPELLEGVRHAVEERLAELSPCTHDQWEESREEVRLAVRRYVNRLLGRKPVVQTLIVWV